MLLSVTECLLAGSKLTWQSARVLRRWSPASPGRWCHWRRPVSDTPHPAAHQIHRQSVSQQSTLTRDTKRLMAEPGAWKPFWCPVVLQGLYNVLEGLFLPNIHWKNKLMNSFNKNIVLWSRKCPQLSSPGWRWCLWTSPPPGHRWSCCWNTGPAPTEKHRWQTPMWRKTVWSDFTDTYLVVSHGSSHIIYLGNLRGTKK